MAAPLPVQVPVKGLPDLVQPHPPGLFWRCGSPGCDWTYWATGAGQEGRRDAAYRRHWGRVHTQQPLPL